MRLFSNWRRALIFGASFAMVIPIVLLPIGLVWNLINGVGFAIAVGVLIAYGFAVIRALKVPVWEGQHLLTFGIFFTWSAVALKQTGDWGTRILGINGEFLTSRASATITWIVLLGGILHLMATGAIDKQIPKENWVRLGLTVAAGLMVVLVLVAVFGNRG